MENLEDYKKLLSEIIKKQMDILGSEVAVRKATNVPGLTINESGEVTDINGDPTESMQKLVDEYIALSGEIVKSVLSPVFAKYPDIQLKLK